jgi:hypothetical protein
MQPIPIIFGKRAMFIPHDGRAKSHLSKLDQFAEHLADGLTPTQAAHRMGKTGAYGNSMLQRLRGLLGPQAV